MIAGGPRDDATLTADDAVAEVADALEHAAPTGGHDEHRYGPTRRKVRRRLRKVLHTSLPHTWRNLAPKDVVGLVDPTRVPLPSLQTLVRPARSAEVTRTGEEAPSELPLESLWGEVKALYQTGLHPAIALHVRHRGRVVLDRTIGHVHHMPGQAPGPVATPDTLFSLFSGSKILTAVVVHAAVEDGLLSLDDRVADYLPGFARHGKDAIRVRHLLQHTAGIPDMPPGLDLDGILAAGRMPLDPLYELVPQSRPGKRVAYHALTGWFLLEQLLEQVTGRPLAAYARERLLDPLGLTTLGYGAPADRHADVAKHAVTGPPTPAPIARIFERNIGVSLERAIEVTNSSIFLDAVLPSANVLGTPAHATAFMEMLLRGGELGGVRVLRPSTIARMVSDVTPVQIDGTFGFPIRYGLGVMMGGLRFSLFGLNTRGAYGHLGLSNVVVYADPARDLAVSFLNTGKPLLAPGMLRWYWVLQRIALMVPRRR